MSSFRENVLVLGASGLLGRQLLCGAYLQNYRCFGQGRGPDLDIQTDLLDNKRVSEMVMRTQPSIIINLVGLTNVDICEQFPNDAYSINVQTLQNVLKASESLSLKPRLLHISTDQVYDGHGPHHEENVTLTNYYAFSKYAAELVAKSAGGIILRTNFFGKSRTDKRKSITDWIYEELIAGRKIQVFDDVLFSPLSMHTLCGLIEKTIGSSLSGIFNLGAHEGLSKADFAFRFADLAGLPKSKIMRVKTSEVNFLKTYRPKDMRMDVSLIEKAIRINLPDLEKEIEQVAQEYKI